MVVVTTWPKDDRVRVDARQVRLVMVLRRLRPNSQLFLRLRVFYLSGEKRDLLVRDSELSKLENAGIEIRNSPRLVEESE